MNKIIFSLLLLMSFNLFSQDFKIFERVTNDKFPIHCCYHSVETSSSDIILAEACCDYINGALGNTGMNLFKLNAADIFSVIEFLSSNRFFYPIRAYESDS